jgi:hypothetical protein
MAKQSNLRALATAPLTPFKHERVTVDEWESAKLIVRQLTAGDWIDYRALIARAREAAGLEPGEPSERPVNVIPATALVLVRTLFGEDGKRVLSDRDADDVAASFSEVHGRLVDKAFSLSGITTTSDPVADAGNV